MKGNPTIENLQQSLTEINKQEVNILHQLNNNKYLTLIGIEDLKQRLTRVRSGKKHLQQLLSQITMKNQLAAVALFHTLFKHPVADEPTGEIPKQRIALRFELMAEENKEYLEAAAEGNLTEVADALGDMLYILCGTIIEHGLQDKIEAVFDEIQSSNMSKLGADGQPIFREDGKILKGPNYFKPDIAAVLKGEYRPENLQKMLLRETSWPPANDKLRRAQTNHAKLIDKDECNSNSIGQDFASTMPTYQSPNLKRSQDDLQPIPGMGYNTQESVGRAPLKIKPRPPHSSYIDDNEPF